MIPGLAGIAGFCGSASAPATDPFFSDVALLVHFTGANGSTTFTDLSSRAHTLSAVNQAQIQSNKLELDGNDDWVTAADHADWTLGGDCTLEAFGVVFDAFQASNPILSHWEVFVPANQRGWTLRQVSNTSMQFNLSTTGGGGGAVVTPLNHAWTPVAGTPYDFAMVRSGSDWSLYIDGSRVATGSSAAVPFDAGIALAIGGQNPASLSGNSEQMDGRMTAVRITLNDRYSGASYVVPSLPLPTS